MSGQIAGMVKDEKSCKEIIEQMMNEMEDVYKRQICTFPSMRHRTDMV